MTGIARVATIATLSLLLLVDLPSVYTSPVEPSKPSDEVHAGRLGAVASENEQCSHFGTDMLQKGGNAADALVATSVCVGTVAMYHSGIGGGGFTLVKSPSGSFEFIDHRETAPAAAFEDMYQNNTKAATHGGLASGVPGDLRGLEYLHNKYGKLPWSTVFQPSIDLARDGFRVTEDLVSYSQKVIADEGDFLCNDPSFAIDFCPNGTRLDVGDIMTRKRYSNTLEAVAKHGVDAFYTGDIAEATIRAIQAANGTMTLEDLRNYTVETRDTAQIDYRGYKITSTTTPTSGVIALGALKILGTYDDFFTPGNVNLSTHRLDEAFRFAYGQRTMLGDPSFVANMTAYQNFILSNATTQGIRSKILDARTQNVSAYNPEGLESLETPGTSHIASTDHTGLAISTITTINTFYGSKLLVPETGVLLNDEMDDFSIPGASNSFGYIPSEANYVRPGKRPLSSGVPAIITHPNGSLYMIAGATGGSRIITATVQNIIHVLDQGFTAAEALAQPRLHDQLVPNRVSVEYSFDNSTVAFMEGRGHNVTRIGYGQSASQAIRVLPDGAFDAAGEPRQKNSGGVAV